MLYCWYSHGCDAYAWMEVVSGNCLSSTVSFHPYVLGKYSAMYSDLVSVYMYIHSCKLGALFLDLV